MSLNNERCLTCQAYCSYKEYESLLKINNTSNVENFGFCTDPRNNDDVSNTNKIVNINFWCPYYIWNGKTSSQENNNGGNGDGNIFAGLTIFNAEELATILWNKCILQQENKIHLTDAYLYYDYTGNNKAEDLNEINFYFKLESTNSAIIEFFETLINGIFNDLYNHIINNTDWISSLSLSFNFYTNNLNVGNPNYTYYNTWFVKDYHNSSSLIALYDYLNIDIRTLLESVFDPFDYEAIFYYNEFLDTHDNLMTWEIAINSVSEYNQNIISDNVIPIIVAFCSVNNITLNIAIGLNDSQLQTQIPTFYNFEFIHFPA